MSDARVHAFVDDVLGDFDATGIAELVATKQVSPREVVEASIARAEKVNGELNGIATADFERALLSVVQPRGGAFSGVPTFIKDNTDAAGLPTGHGSEAITPKLAKKDAPTTRIFRDLGFVVLGKSTLPEFGLSMSTEFMTRPPTRNPWNPAYSSGASSGGAAALVAAGVVPIAHANDGGGSIRIPAACCGLVGLKPTRGRFKPGHTERVMPVNIAVEGVVTRSVRDTARFYEAAERTYAAPKMPAIGRVDGPGSRRLRIGVVFDSITDTVTDPETRAVLTEIVELLTSMGHEVVEMRPPVPDKFEEDFVAYWKFLGFMLRHFASQIYGVKVDAEKFDGLTKGLASSFPHVAHRAPLGFRRLHRSDREYARSFREWDVVLSPVLARTVPELGWLSPTQPFDVVFPRLREIVAFTPLNNATGGPAVSLPLGLSGGGLPIGIQLSGAHGAERLLLELAYELEEARPVARIQDEVSPSRR